MRLRQAEGIAAAKARGVRFGRPGVVVPEEFIPLYKKWKDNELTHGDVEKKLGISKTKFYRLARMLESVE